MLDFKLNFPRPLRGLENLDKIGKIGMQNNFFDSQFILLLFILTLVWTLPWKGVALWKAAKNGHKIWFVALLLLNTLAVLEILYIFIFSKKKT